MGILVPCDSNRSPGQRLEVLIFRRYKVWRKCFGEQEFAGGCKWLKRRGKKIELVGWFRAHMREILPRDYFSRAWFRRTQLMRYLMCFATLSRREEFPGPSISSAISSQVCTNA